MVASSEPNSSSISDCCLVGFFNDYSHIAYCKLNDMSWNMIELKKEFQVWDVEIIGSKLYVVATSKTSKSLDSMMVFDLLQDSSSKPPKAKVLAKLPPRPNPIITQSGTKRTICGSILRYIAKDGVSGELFLIYMSCDFTYEMEHVSCFDMITEYVIPPKITSVKVFMLIKAICFLFVKQIRMAPFATLQTLHGSVLGSKFLGQDHHFLLKQPSTAHHRKSTCEVVQAQAKFNILEIMGGRGLCNGEKGLQQELMKKRQVDDDEKPQPEITASSDKDEEENSGVSSVAVPEDGFEKEMMGLTGGFPGGEKGLIKFIEQNPPHKPASVLTTS